MVTFTISSSRMLARFGNYNRLWVFPDSAVALLNDRDECTIRRTFDIDDAAPVPAADGVPANGDGARVLAEVV
jgi:hypothetical protein